MAKRCSDCRWYDGKNCIIHGSHRNASDGGSCVEYVNNSSPDADHRCKSCRWYDGSGRKCQILSGVKNPSDGGSCNKYSVC